MKKHKKNCKCCVCRGKRGEYKGRNNPNFKSGITLKKHYCNVPGCKNKICISNVRNGSGKCEECSKKENKLSKILTKDFLIQEYIKNNKSSLEIGNEIGCNKVTVRRYLKKYGIKIKNGNFKDGRTLKKYYCIEPNCHNEISYSAWLYGTKKCKFCVKKGKLAGNYKDGRTLKKYYCIEGCGREIHYDTWRKGSGRCMHCSTRNTWKNKKFKERNIKAILKGLQLKPNKPEKKLRKLLNTLFPNEYEINTNGNTIINGKIPDFVNVNGQKKIIEMYGDYWHSDKHIKKNGCYEDTEKGRIKHFKKLGYSTLIVWEHELKDIDKLTNRLMEFNGDKLCKK
ncbi:MAG: hypothetical protein WC979_09985 [Candidatus Pacearchaeota archaeon]|jgi:G:T-mismatch repair DNA endonuclease (very short patch repair protein)